MTFRPLDLQVSIPRTPEAGVMQGQANLKPVVEQNRLAESAAKETELLRSKNTEVEHAVGLNVRADDEEKRKQEARLAAKRGKKDGDKAEEGNSPAHPYKGHHFDVSL